MSGGQNRSSCLGAGQGGQKLGQNTRLGLDADQVRVRRSAGEKKNRTDKRVRM